MPETETTQTETTADKTVDTITPTEGTKAIGTDDKATLQAVKPVDQTIVADKGDDTTKPIDWPEDWRERLAKGDDKKLQRLARYGSLLDVGDALMAAQDKIRAGLAKPKLPENPTPEQLAEYRKENGIPESPDKYDLTLQGGVVIGEADKPLVESFTKAMHGHNWSNDQVKQGLEWYYAEQEAIAERQSGADAENRKKAEDALRDEWGPDYRVNVRIYKEWLDGLPEGIGEALNVARDKEGRLLGANPAFVQWVVGLQRELNPAATVVPGSGSNSNQAIESEMETIRKQMADPNSPYNKGPKIRKVDPSTGYEREETALAWRYAELLAAQERMGKRAA